MSCTGFFMLRKSSITERGFERTILSSVLYNEHGDLVRTHERSYTPKSWVVIPSDMPKEYSDYG